MDDFAPYRLAQSHSEDVISKFRELTLGTSIEVMKECGSDHHWWFSVVELAGGALEHYDSADWTYDKCMAYFNEILH